MIGSFVLSYNGREDHLGIVVDKFDSFHYYVRWFDGRDMTVQSNSDIKSMIRYYEVVHGK